MVDGGRYKFQRLINTANKPSSTTIHTILVTTVLVADRPTAAAPAPVPRPRWQPIPPIKRPKTVAFTKPRMKSLGLTALSS